MRKISPRADFLLLGVFQQLAAELCGQQNCPDLALERDLGAAALRGLNGEIFHLADADAGTQQMLSIRSARRVSPALCAAVSRRSYSARVSSRSAARKMRR